MSIETSSRPILAGGNDPLLSQAGFSSHFTLVGDWIHYCLDDLGSSESELGNGRHVTSVFKAISCLSVYRNHCDDMASEF